MPLFLSCSNRVEALHAHLSRVLREAPLPDPFQPEVILVPGMAMQRWVNLQLASSLGVAANIHYSLPAAWVWELAQAFAQNASSAEDPLSRERAAWRIFSLLPGLLPRSEFEELRHYLDGDGQGIKRWALSEKLADVFDRYQYYRPDWIRAWSAGRESPSLERAGLPAWQGLLWQAMVADCDGEHRVAMIDRLLQALSSPQKDPRLTHLPGRISCFALSSLPPLLVQVLQALSSRLDVLLLQHSPTGEYWADLRSKKAMARLRIEHPDESAYYETGNELLASWGRQGQAFQDLLLQDEGLESVQDSFYFDPGTDSLLHRLQADILALTESSVKLIPDSSVEISVCHSPMRECQVLHDRLLSALEQDPTLKPEDILVMIPEISRYAPYVEAVFRYDEQSGRPFIPWNLSDLSLSEEHPLIQVFLRLLALPSSRFSYSELASFLEVPRIASHFGLQDAAREELMSLLQEAGIRWGLDGEHKTHFELPGTEQNTWRHGLDRLLAGYAMTDVPLWQGVAPVMGASGGSALALGRFCEFLERLRDWCTALTQPRSARKWQETLNILLDQLMGQGTEEEDKLQQIRDALDELGQLAQEQILSVELLRHWLQDTLGTRSEHHRFFSGGVTLCGMRPLRSLPFRMICVLGMNDAAFPRREQPQSFDGMSTQWRPGDPRKGDEDRYLLLETLLCARERLYFSYTGRSLRDNSELQPSVLLREFLDFVDQHYLSEAADDVPLSQLLTTEYPMQPFSGRQFLAETGTVDRRSYDAWWCAVAQSLQNTTAGPVDLCWPQNALPAPTEAPETLDLSRLIRFLQHPVKGFFTTRLRLMLLEENPHEDEETFSLVGLEQWQVNNTLIQRALQDSAGSPQEELALLEARGVLPHGAMARSSFKQSLQQANALLEGLQDYRQREPETISLSLDCRLPDGSVQVLSAQIPTYYRGLGLLHCSPSSLKAKTLLPAWLEHLALCATNTLQQGESTLLVCRDERRRFPCLPQQEALDILIDCVALYRDGLTRPLPLFPGASACLALDASDKALAEALRAWQGSEFSSVPGDSQDPYIALAHRHCGGHPLELEEHVQLAQRLYGPPYRLGEVV